MTKYKFTILLAAALVIVAGCKESSAPESATTANHGIYKGPIIDMHVHAFDAGNPMFGLAHPPTLRGQTFQGVANADELRQQVLAKFNQYNIVKAVVANGRIWKDDAPDKVLIADANQPVDSLRNQHAAGRLQVIGEMAPFYAGIQADDPSQLPYFELAEELGIPVGFHILPGGPNYGFHTIPDMLGGMRVYNARPMQVEEVLVRYPDLRLYIMHGGWPFVEEMKALMYAHPNLYVDLAVLNWILPEAEFYSYLQALMRAGFGDRLMYGSDQMVWPETMDIAIETINSAEFLTLDQKAAIFYDNAAEFLGFSEEEINMHKNP